MHHVAVVALTADKRRVRHRLGGFRRHHIVAGPAHRVHVSNQLDRAIRLLRVAGFATSVRERRMVIFAKQFRSLGIVRIMTVRAVRVGKIITFMFGLQIGIKRVATSAYHRWLVGDESAMVRSVRDVALIAFTRDDRRMHGTFTELGLQGLMTGVAKVGDPVSERRRTHDRHSVGCYWLHATDDQSFFHRAMRVMTPCAVAIRHWSVDMRFGRVEIFSRMAAQAKRTCFVGQQCLFFREVRRVTSLAAVLGRRMFRRHRQSQRDIIMATEAESGSFFAHQMFRFGVVGLMTGGAVLLHIRTMLRQGGSRPCINVVTTLAKLVGGVLEQFARHTLVRGMALAAIFCASMDRGRRIARRDKLSMTTKTEAVVRRFRQLRIVRSMNIVARRTLTQQHRHMGDDRRIMDEVGMTFAAYFGFGLLEQFIVRRGMRRMAIVAVLRLNRCMRVGFGRPCRLIGVTILARVAGGHSSVKCDFAGRVRKTVARVAGALREWGVRSIGHQTGLVIGMSGVAVRTGQSSDKLSFVRGRDLFALEFVATLAKVRGGAF